MPPPKHLRREQRRDGGYNMVPAYTREEMLAYRNEGIDAALDCALWFIFDSSEGDALREEILKLKEKE